MKKSLALFTAILATLSLNLFIPKVLSLAGAQTTEEVTPTESPDSEEENTTAEKLRERIEKIVEQKKDQVKGVVDNLTNKKTGFIGQVSRVSEETIALETNRGTKIMPLDEGVKLIKGEVEINPESIEVDSWAMVLGILEDDSFVPRRIVFSKTSLRPDQPLAYLGSLKNISSNKIDFQPRSKNETMTLTIARGISYQDNEGAAAAKADFSEFDQVLLVGYFDEANDENVATVIRALAPFQKDKEDE